MQCCRVLGLFLLAAVLVFACVTPAPAAPDTRAEPDAICAALFREYIAGPHMIPTEDVLAASDLIASRGRTTGFWNSVLEGMRSAKGWDEALCVRILGKMLEDDAQAREILRSTPRTRDPGAYPRMPS